MKIEIKLENWESCKGCPLHQRNPRPDAGGLIPPNICGAGYSSYSGAEKYYLDHRLIRPKKCIEENGK